MNYTRRFQTLLAATLACVAFTASADYGSARLTPVVERRSEPVAAPVGDARGGPAAAGVDTPSSGKRPDWIAVLAGLAVAGWIVTRRHASPME